MAAIFSEYEIREIGIKTGGEGTHISCECVGTGEEEMTTKIIKKTCRGVVKKKVVKPTGEGTLKLSMHIPSDLYYKMFGMEASGLKQGIKAYGQLSKHANLSITAKVLDEDGNVKYKAYPNCIIEKGVSRKVENGAEEVAEIELEIAVMPDENGYGLYEAIESEISAEEELKTKWMTDFTPAMAKAV